jgi:thioredoxin-related protein
MKSMKSANCLLVLILSWFACSCAYARDRTEVPLVRDFVLEAKAAQELKVPILVLFSRRNCAFCDQVLKEFLVPMQHNEEYDTKVIMRRIDVGSAAKLRLFSGKNTTYAQFARQNNIFLTPTIKLFDAEGNELTEPLVGLTTPDYYGGFLDQRIDEALAKVRSGK